ncbi:MAG TPA: hypothetical protein VIK65_03905 [Candidatus Limnocylindrales bacterium]|jgi:hypothetical protein
MVDPMPRPAAIVAVTGDDERHAAVVKRAASVALTAGSTVILWDRDAAGSPLESPLPTDWSGDGEQEQFGDRLAPGDLVAAGQEPLARQVDRLREEGIDAWGWLPEQADAEHLAQYAAGQRADLILVSAGDDDFLGDLRDLAARREADHAIEARVETVPG